MRPVYLDLAVVRLITSPLSVSVCLSVSLSVSLSVFNGHFPGEPG